MRYLNLLTLILAASSAFAQPGSEPRESSCADSISAQAARYQVGVDEADALYRSGQYGASADRYVVSFATYHVSDYVDLYGAARAAARAGEVGRAYGFLHRAIEAGWEDDVHMERASAFAPLRAYGPLWVEVKAALEDALGQRYGERLDLDLRAELLDMAWTDQLERQRLDSLDQVYGWPLPDSLMAPAWAEIERADSLNLIRLERIVSEHGWPRISAVGRPGAQAAFLVVQHARLEVQERYLPLLRAAVDMDEGIPSNLAYLVDRVRVRKGEPQLYGSQVRQNSETGELEFFPIEDEGNVDIRRAAVALGPLVDYARAIGFEYTSPSVSPDH